MSAAKQYDLSDPSANPALNPDCRDGRHRACRGDAWDMSADRPCDCICACHRQPPTADLSVQNATRLATLVDAALAAPARSKPRFEYVWNEHAAKLTHLVPSIDGFDAGEDVPTVCGMVTTEAQPAPEFPVCPACALGMKS